MEEYIDVLQKQMLFHGLDNRRLSVVFEKMNGRIRHFEKNEMVWNIGIKTSEIGIVVKGSAHISLLDAEGNRMILKECRVGHSFGESIALTKIENFIMVVATSRCVIAFCSLQKIIDNTSFADDAVIKANLQLILASKNIALILKNEIIAKKTIREKMMTYFHYHMQATRDSILNTSFTREELADYLCVNRSALSRELGKMQNEGLVSFTKKRFIVLKTK